MLCSLLLPFSMSSWAQVTVTINIYSINGKVTYSEQVDNTGLINKPIDLKSYPKGMYFLHLINNNMTHTEKIIIE